MMPVAAENLENIRFQIDGEVYASEDYQKWNKTGKYYADFWSINDSNNISFTGSGVVDGQGYWWWMREYALLNNGRRPHLLSM